MEKLRLSAQVYDKILKVSRTIADLEGSENIETDHLAKPFSTAVWIVMVDEGEKNYELILFGLRVTLVVERFGVKAVAIDILPLNPLKGTSRNN